jgi:hypothetical protein
VVQDKDQLQSLEKAGTVLLRGYIKGSSLGLCSRSSSRVGFAEILCERVDTLFVTVFVSVVPTSRYSFRLVCNPPLCCAFELNVLGGIALLP